MSLESYYAKIIMISLPFCDAILHCTVFYIIFLYFNHLYKLFILASCKLMATANTNQGGSPEESSVPSENYSLRSEESRLGSEESRRRLSSPTVSWDSELASIRHRLKFVLKLKEEFVCPICRGVVLNPQQNSCGHIYCFHCLQGLL